MKATLVVLAVTATGFAAAATYVHRQLSVERVRTQEEVARSNPLEQRVRAVGTEGLGSFRAAEAENVPLQSRPIDGPDSARMSLRLSRERIREPGSR